MSVTSVGPCWSDSPLVEVRRLGGAHHPLQHAGGGGRAAGGGPLAQRRHRRGHRRPDLVQQEPGALQRRRAHLPTHHIGLTKCVAEQKA